MSQHNLFSLAFTSLTSESWHSLPDLNTIKQQIASAALAHCEVSGDAMGLYSAPNEIKEIRLTDAAADQIRCMWHGQRTTGRTAPPTIPLKIFVAGYGQSNGNTWAILEFHPGMDNWESTK